MSVARCCDWAYSSAGVSWCWIYALIILCWGCVDAEYVPSICPTHILLGIRRCQVYTYVEPHWQWVDSKYIPYLNLGEGEYMLSIYCSSTKLCLPLRAQCLRLPIRQLCRSKRLPELNHCCLHNSILVCLSIRNLTLSVAIGFLTKNATVTASFSKLGRATSLLFAA